MSGDTMAELFAEVECHKYVCADVPEDHLLPVEYVAGQPRPADLRGLRGGRMPARLAPDRGRMRRASSWVCLARLERDRLWPDAIADSLRVYGNFVRDPAHRLPVAEGCGLWECCPDPYRAREMLAAAAAVLPPRDAREFRKKIQALDELW